MLKGSVWQILVSLFMKLDFAVVQECIHFGIVYKK